MSLGEYDDGVRLVDAAISIDDYVGDVGVGRGVLEVNMRNV